MHQWLGFEPGQVRKDFCLSLQSAAVSRVLGHSFRPFAVIKSSRVENTTCTLCTDININESRDLAHETGVVRSAIKSHTYMHTAMVLYIGLQDADASLST